MVKSTIVLSQLLVQLSGAGQSVKTDKIGNELLKKGGKRKVPCLRIEKDGKVQWMYNSKDIIVYLQNSFA